MEMNLSEPAVVTKVNEHETKESRSDIASNAIENYDNEDDVCVVVVVVVVVVGFDYVVNCH